MITLDHLVEVAREKMDADRRQLSAPELRALLDDSGALQRPAGRLAQSLGGPGTRVIAEVKGASPVSGTIRAGYDPAAIAREYEAGGAAAISVLTEEMYFGGSLAALAAVAEGVTIPVLRKDFIVDPYQIEQAALAGASAVLLIAEVLTAEQLADLVGVAHACRLDALVEIHTPALLPAAEAAGSGLIGVNNRNLATMTVDWRYAIEVAPLLPPGVIKVAESGIATAPQLAALIAAGYDAALVGSSLMAAGAPRLALRALLEGGEL
jgi:indole-3-glycerol phosphate synthase